MSVRDEVVRLDGEGRVAFTSPLRKAPLAAAGRARRRPAEPGTNANCGYCNTVDGCSPINNRCNPNTVANCGCRKAVE